MYQTILIIEDHDTVRTLVSDYFAREGFCVTTARDGNEGLLVASHLPPDLILLDVMMSGLDGYGFLQAYRRDHTTPVILLTARSEEGDRVVGTVLGADDYLTRPFALRELVAHIRALLARTSPPAPATQPAHVQPSAHRH
jgi:DNA-binding response OmpR family regulator